MLRVAARTARPPTAARAGDRKSTRLNSSHSQISYAVFCLKKTANSQHPIGVVHPSERAPSVPDKSRMLHQLPDSSLCHREDLAPSELLSRRYSLRPLLLHE